MKSLFKLPISVKLFSLAVLLRLLIMPFLYHPDIKTYSFQVSFLQKGVLNIYTYLTDNKASLPLKEEFVYQPLTYFTLGAWQMVVKPLMGGGFNDWLWDASQQSVERVGVFRHLFLLKLPYLFFDIAIAFVLMGFFKTQKARRQAFLIWLFNPFSIFIIYAFSNLDVIPVFLISVSLLLSKKEKYFYSALVLGIAAGFKAYPLMLLPLVAFSSKSFKKALMVLVSGLGVFVLTLIPFWSKSLVNSAVVSGLTTRIFLPSVDLGFGVKIAIPVVAIALVYLLSVGANSKKIEYLSSALLMILLATIHYHMQWLMWLLPFVVILMVAKPKLRLYLIILSCSMFILPFFFNDKSMSVSLFSLYSYYFTLVPTPFSVVQRFVDVSMLLSAIQSVILATSVYIIWKLFDYQKS